MATHADGRDRLALVTAGQQILRNVLPLRHPDSRVALETFMAAIERVDLPPVDLDGALLECLTAVDARAGRCIPSLAERSLSDAHSPCRVASGLRGVLLRYPDGAVQQTVGAIRARFSDVTVSARGIADLTGRRHSSLDVAFKSQMDAPAQSTCAKRAWSMPLGCSLGRARP